MLSLDHLLCRPGLPIEERLLILTKTAIWPGDWQELGECMKRAQNQQLPRADLEETLLQAVLFYGFPRVVTAFGVLNEIWHTEHAPTGGVVGRDQLKEAGLQLFDAIYGKNSSTVHQLLQSYHAELHDFVLEAAYGRILSRPGLTPRIRELLACAALAKMGQTPQLIAHARGAIHFGAGPTELRETLISSLRSEALIDDLLRKVSPLTDLDKN